MPAELELVILVGLQASGKTTFSSNRFAETHIRVSKDDFRNARNREKRQTELIKSSLQEGRSVVVDNTNPTRNERAVLLELAREFGSRTIGFYFESRVDVCLGRNSKREGKQRVPDVAIYSTIKKLERPSFDEGFDSLFYVRSCGDDGFQVLEWDEEAG